MEVTFQGYPWRLLQLVDPRVAPADKEILTQEFWDARECELDAWFSEPLRKALPDRAKLDGPVFELLTAVRRHCHATNMDFGALAE